MRHRKNAVTSVCGLCVIPFVHLVEAVAIAITCDSNYLTVTRRATLRKYASTSNLATPQARKYSVLRHSVLKAHLLNNLYETALDSLCNLGQFFTHAIDVVFASWW